jgi:hypothetical protein
LLDNEVAVFPGESALGTGRNTVTTAGGTSLRPDDDLPAAIYSLRVVTPQAVEGATLEKDRRADARPVMDGIALDIKD